MSDEKKKFSLLDRIQLGSFLIIFAVLGFYALNFPNGLSKDQNTWANFGSFFGGVLGPILSLVSILAIIKTVDIQIKSSQKLSREDHSIRWIEDLYNSLSMLVNISYSLINGDGLSANTIISEITKEEDVNKNLIVNEKIITSKVQQARELLTNVERLSRFSLEKDEEEEIRIMISFINRLLNIVNGYDSLNYLFYDMNPQKNPLLGRDTNDPPSPEEIDLYYENIYLFIDYYNLDKIEKWFDRILQTILSKIFKDSNMLDHFESIEYKELKKKRIMEVTGVDF